MSIKKGFTLIEVLIVIAVIGILSSMMMMSSTESVSTAKASNIISNLRNFSMAAMAYYTEHVDEVGKNPTGYHIELGTVTPYMHNEGDVPDKENYIVTNNGGTWWAGYKLSGTVDEGKIKQKLANRAESANLKGSGSDTPPDKGDTDSKYKDSHSYVWLLIRSSRN